MYTKDHIANINIRFRKFEDYEAKAETTFH